MSGEATTAPGWYGKLSSLGDFASRRLAPDWIGCCDEWLASCMTASHVQLDSTWLATYLAAPVWRFAWAPGVIDKRWWFGVLMPSCDNVGRYFPLIVAQPRDAPPTDRIALDHLDLWWSHVSRATLHTLQDQVALADFEADLAAAPPWPVAVPWPVGAPVPVEDRVRMPVQAGAGLVGLAGAWAAQGLLANMAGCSLWWPVVAAAECSVVTLSKGLPQAACFTDLLTGRW